MDRRRPPLGATWTGAGVHFALESEHASEVELCLFDPDEPMRETTRISLSRTDENIWHVYVREAEPGLPYGYRVRGPYAPDRGERFNPAKLLVDPRARVIAGALDWEGPVHGDAAGKKPHRPSRDPRDSALHVPRSVVIDPLFDWGDDAPPATPWHRSVVYECHVKGMTARHPDVPDALRGTYLGLASDPILEHLRSLGVTAVELLPVHHRVTELHLHRKDLENYWGYNTLGFFAPDSRFATGDRGEQVAEFKGMVRALHKAGIEVILDVVYNHTCEGDHRGPTLSMRGVDNRAWYRLQADAPARYEDMTGCGNTVDLRSPATRRFVLDSLRYWVMEMRVDGFRFDLAPAMAPDDAGASVFEAMVRDPVLSKCKLIAEPWDLSGRGGFLGRFPPGFSEWNGPFRDAVRGFWRGDPGRASDLATRLAGSSDLFEGSGRSPQASVNFVTCHDGFSLADLVSYERKHNEANGEENRDGSDDNLSRNWGDEGDTSDSTIQRVRRKVRKSLVASLLLAQGVPMIAAGDEIARTQQGNNNAYCQDNEISWLDWNLGRRQHDLLRFTKEMIRLRADNPVLRRRGFFQGREIGPTGEKDLYWFRPDGNELTDDDWNNPECRVLGMRIASFAADDTDAQGRPHPGAILLALFNAEPEPVRFLLPEGDRSRRLAVRIHSGEDASPAIDDGGLTVEGHSVVILGPPKGKIL